MATVRSESQMPGSGQHRQPQRRTLRRPLRLLAAIGIILGGLCLVLAMMGVMIELGPHQPQLVAGRTLGTYQGLRTKHPMKILVPHAGLFGVAWKFRCPPGRK